MRRSFPRFTILFLSLAIIASGFIRLPGASASGQHDTQKMTQEQYVELQRKRIDAADKAKSDIKKHQARGAEVAAEKRKRKVPHTKVTFSFSSVNTREGLVGIVTDKTTGATIRFESRRDGDFLSSRISEQSGITLIEYVESERAPVAHPLTGATLYEPVPSLRLGGFEYQVLQGPVLDEARRIVASPQAGLIRMLALYIAEYAPGEDLESERRGLEVPFQALQKFYREPTIEEYGGGDLTAARRFGAQRREAAKSASTNNQREPLLPEAGDCEQSQCGYVDNHDYQLSEQGGYVVKSLSPRLVLSHNFARPDARPGDEHDHDHDHHAALRGKGFRDVRTNAIGFKPTFIKTSSFEPFGVKVGAASSAAAALPVAAVRRDDGSQVGDCYGRCGSGCGNWTHQWVDTPVADMDFIYCEPPDRNGPMPDCSSMCCSIERRLVSYTGIAIHTASGKVTLGAKAHDSCCRSLGGPCWLLSLGPCAAALALAADCGIPGVGEIHYWSYIGGHREGYDYYTGNCCIDIGPVS